MAVDYISLGKRVKLFRKRLGCTQEAMAEKCGLTPAHFSHVETGNTKVSLPTLVDIANALGVSIDDLLVDSLEKTTHVSVKEINDLLFDCTPGEYRALLKLLATGKEMLRQER